MLSHAFFEEDVGLKVEVVSQESTKIVFRLRVIDPKKRTHKHKENEAIQFEYDLETDKFITIVEEMVSNIIQKHICINLYQYVTLYYRFIFNLSKHVTMTLL